MFEPLTDPAAIDAANQFFNDLIEACDVQAQLPLLRPKVEALRSDVLSHKGMLSTQNQLRGFLWGLTVAGTLTPEQGDEFGQRLEIGRHAGWL